MLAARDEVARLLAEGRKQAEIAQELGISAGRVSQLVKAIRNLGGGEKQPGPNSASKAVPPRNRPPPGPNRGSFKQGDERAGAPAGNANNLVHGAYSMAWARGLSPEDMAVVENPGTPTTLEQVDHQLGLCYLRERWLLERLQGIQAKRGPWYERQGKRRRKQVPVGDGASTRVAEDVEETRTPALLQMAVMVDRELTRVQGRIRELLALRHQIESHDDPNNPGGGGDVHVGIGIPGVDYPADQEGQP